MWVGLPPAHWKPHAAKSCGGTPKPTGARQPHTQLGVTVAKKREARAKQTNERRENTMPSVHSVHCILLLTRRS